MPNHKLSSHLYAGDEQEKMTAKFMIWHVLEQGLRILHPFMPFISEEIWQKFPQTGETIMLSDYPEANPEIISISAEKNMLFVQDIIRVIRNLRTEMKIGPGVKLTVLMKTVEGEEQVLLEENRAVIEKLANLGELMISCDIDKPEQAAMQVVGSTEVYVPLEGNVDPKQEIERAKREIEKIEKELKRVDGKLSNEKFLAKAPADVVEKEQGIQKELNDKLSKLRESLEIFSK